MLPVPDISNYKNMYDLVLLFFAILTVDVIVLFLTRYFPLVIPYQIIFQTLFKVYSTLAILIHPKCF